MTFEELNRQLKTPVFTTKQIGLLFDKESKEKINIQLWRWEKQGKLIRLKKSIYKLVGRAIDDLVLAGILYKPSYVSLESALKIAGIIPEEVMELTSVTTTTSKKIKNTEGVFTWSKINKNLFFGFQKQKDPQSGLYYNLAEAEKALLDWVYIRKINNLSAFRINRDNLNKTKLTRYARLFPKWVRKVINE